MSQVKFASVLKRIELDQNTGTLVCVGEDNLFGRVYLVDGKPRVARCGNSQGPEAMQLMIEGTLVSAKFHDGAKLIKSDSDDDGIDGFSAGDADPVADDLGNDGAMSASEIDSLTDTTETDPKLLQKLSDPVREIMAQELVEYVGPVAQMIVSGLEQDIRVMDALKVLAFEIGDRDMARQYVENVRLKLS
jgi:hypothetical protein